MLLKVHQVKERDSFTDFINERISDYLKGWELCILTERGLKEDDPESVRIMHNSQAAKLFDMAYELNVFLAEYDKKNKH